MYAFWDSHFGYEKTGGRHTLEQLINGSVYSGINIFSCEHGERESENKRRRRLSPNVLEQRYEYFCSFFFIFCEITGCVVKVEQRQAMCRCAANVMRVCGVIAVFKVKQIYVRLFDCCISFVCRPSQWTRCGAFSHFDEQISQIPDVADERWQTGTHTHTHIWFMVRFNKLFVNLQCTVWPYTMKNMFRVLCFNCSWRRRGAFN